MAAPHCTGLFTIEVINQVIPGPQTSYLSSVVDNENLYKAMCRLEATPGTGFTFKSQESSFGHFITTINRLEQDTAENYYWLIYINDLDNPAPVGVDGLFPKDGEKYIFAYTNTTEDHANKFKE